MLSRWREDCVGGGVLGGGGASRVGGGSVSFSSWCKERNMLFQGELNTTRKLPLKYVQPSLRWVFHIIQ